MTSGQGFSEVEIETTITVGLWRFQNSKMELPTEVELCLVGQEAHGWRAWAIKTLRQAAEKYQRENTLVIG